MTRNKTVLRRRGRFLLAVGGSAALCLAAGLSGLSSPPSSAATSSAPHPAHATTGAATAELTKAAGPAGSAFCRGLGKRYGASAAAWALCRGTQPQGPLSGQKSAVHADAPQAGQATATAPGNTDAASPAEDVLASGARVFGQNETSIAASGPYVVEAWNDATARLSSCQSPKAQMTGLGFSHNGGKTFTDMQGLPNKRCAKDNYQGEPSVVAYRAGGKTYFYISSLFDRNLLDGESFLALAACQVTGSGSGARLHCSQPVIAAASTQCITEPGSISDCSFIDKPFLAIDPAHGRLYAAYTEFRVFDAPLNLGAATDSGAIEMSVCDLGTRTGRMGPGGGTPAAPVCEHGTPRHKVRTREFGGKPYLTVQQPDKKFCQYEGASPAVNTATGSLFIGFEHGWSNSFFGPCFSTPMQNVLTKVPRHCLVLREVSPCKGPAARVAVPIDSISAAGIPGYIPLGSGFIANDFPRVAVSGKAGTVSMVWNDTRFHPYGDILLQSFTFPSLRPVQHAPVVLDSPHHGGLTFLPAVRTATAAGRLDVTWYSRNSVATSTTAVMGAIGVRPRATTTPATNVTITNVPSNWDNQNYLFPPDFGDYTDNALNATSRKPYIGGTLYVAWTDGRTGVPQPFEAHIPAGR